jgi:hypothetical protein
MHCEMRHNDVVTLDKAYSSVLDLDGVEQKMKGNL